MPSSRRGAWLLLAARLAGVLVAVLATSGCGLHFGLGMTIERQSLAVTYVRAPEPRVEVRAEWRVKNTGVQPLTAIELRFPDAKAQAVRQLRAEIGGRAAATVAASGANTVRIPLQEPLEINAREEIVVNFAIPADAPRGAAATVSETGFVLPPGDLAPVLLAASTKVPIAYECEPPKKWDFSVRVPAETRVYASGRARGEQKEAGSVLLRFQQRREDGLPFAAGGQFQEEKISAERREVILWTRQALPHDLAERAAETAARTAGLYDAEFGARAAGGETVRIIECPSSQPCAAVPGAALPGAEMYTPEFWSSGARIVDRQLAFTWLEFRVRPDWNEEPYPMGSLADYAADLAAIARAEAGARRLLVQAILSDFDSTPKSGQEYGIFAVRLSDPRPARRAAELKSELFFFALEDAAGHDALSRALQHLLRVEAGEMWRAGDLRSALELESGKGLGPVFRAWLTETGIPAEFRGAYAAREAASGGLR